MKIELKAIKIRIPDFPIDRTWGCRNCSAGFWKDTPRNKAALGGLVPHQWPKD